MEKDPIPTDEKIKELSPIDSARIIYHSVMFAVQQTRHAQSAERLAVAEHKEEFYEDLGDVASRVMVEDTSMPPRSKTVHPLTKAAAADAARYGVLEPRRFDPSAPTRRGPTNARSAFDPEVAPQDEEEMDAHRDVAQTLHTIRDKRAQQKKSRRMFGNSGMVHKRATKKARRRMNDELQERYEAGELTALELRLQQDAVRTTIVTTPPTAMARRRKQIHRMGERTTSRIDRSIERAQVNAEREAEKQAKLERKMQDRASKIQRIRTKTT